MHKRMKRIHTLLFIGLIIFGVSCKSYHPADKNVTQCPIIYPDYTFVTFPSNIAPPNFIIQEEGDNYQTEFGIVGEPTAFIVHGKGNQVNIPQEEWRKLLERAKGKNIFTRICIQKGLEWIGYADIINTVSTYPIDDYLAYRLLYPGYELWNEMGIYQRNLSSYEETAVVENKNFNKQCVNCHTFNQQSPNDMMMHIRGAQGGTLIQHNGKLEKVNPKAEGFKYGATYSSWHPSGKFIAFSTNEIKQMFHSSGKKLIEVSDFDSDLMIYQVEKHYSFTDSLVHNNAYMETFPAWSPDGKTLYFCRAKRHNDPMHPDSIYYNLCRISFDVSTEKLGTPEVIFHAAAQNKSVSFPCVSPDGKYLMFTLSDYGNFSIWHPESDLYLMNLSTLETTCLANVNSEDVESYHSWSSNGHWFVFSSKRIDGLWARPHFASFNPETGETGKPFVLPQKNPEFYKTFTLTYNRPELIKNPITNGQEFERIISQTAIQAQRKH